MLPVVQNTGVLAGVCGTDPFRIMPNFLKQLKEMGFCGVQNFPTVGLIDGMFRQNLEETGMSYAAEVEMIRTAHELDLLTTPYVFNVDEAERMTRAGADVLVVHMGLTTSGSVSLSSLRARGSGRECPSKNWGSRINLIKAATDSPQIGATTSVTLDECVQTIQEIRDACVAIREDIIVLCHGGPIASVEDATFVLSRTRGVHGFFGASSMERLPVETAIKDNTAAFKNILFKQ